MQRLSRALAYLTDTSITAGEKKEEEGGLRASALVLCPQGGSVEQS